MTSSQQAGAGPIELTRIGTLLDLSATTTGANPSEVYERLRKQWGNVAPVQIEPGVPAWLVLGYGEFLYLVRHEKTFSRDTRDWRLMREGALPPSAAIWAFTPPPERKPFSSFHHDGDTRARLRRPLADSLDALPDKVVRAGTERVCRDVFSVLGESGQMDLVGDYAAVVGFGAMASMFGFDPGTAEQLRRASAVIMQQYGPETAVARQRMGEILMGHLMSRKQTSAVDLTAMFARHPDFHNDREIADSMTVPLIAAAEFLTAWIALTLRLVLTDPRFSARWAGGRISLDDALDETLWRDTPVPNSCLPRFATRDLELDGKLIRQGDALVPAMAGANHDPGVFGGDLEIGNRSHVAWGTGPHACPARRQARLITRTAVACIRDELTLTLNVPTDEIQWASTPWVRHPQSLQVTYRRETIRGSTL